MSAGRTQDTEDATDDAPPRLVSRRLVLAFCSDHIADRCETISLDGIERVLLGRAESPADPRIERRITGGAATVHVALDDPRASFQHAELRRAPEGGFTLRDLGSMNGTRIGDLRLAEGPAGEVRLADGDVVQIGHTFFVYRETRSAAPPRPVALGRVRTLNAPFAAGLERLRRVSATTIPVLLLGETGTGKELLARAVHEKSGRSGAFVAVNCGSIPATLLESQLFGHVRGAFSGAARDELGFVRAANEGTLFLDEVGDMPQSSQAALLRVLQEGEVVPVGASRSVRVDVRVLSATHQPLEERMETGGMRRDLYARIAGFVFDVPALRDRKEDLGLLLADLVREHAGEAPVTFQSAAARALFAHDWPMNVRELVQALRTALTLSDGGVVRRADLPSTLRQLDEPRSAAASLPPPASRPTVAPASSDPKPRSAEDEALHAELSRHLAESGGNVTEAARRMGKARQQVQRWMKRLGLRAD